MRKLRHVSFHGRLLPVCPLFKHNPAEVPAMGSEGNHRYVDRTDQELQYLAQSPHTESNPRDTVSLSDTKAVVWNSQSIEQLSRFAKLEFSQSERRPAFHSSGF